MSGTPCMVAAIQNLRGINRKNLLTFEILCQGVPSKTVIEKFYAETASKYGSSVQNHVFRSKDRYIGRNYLNRYQFNNGKVVYLIGEEDPLSLSFQRQIFLRESCYSCQYANEARTTDFTAGDLWKAPTDPADSDRIFCRRTSALGRYSRHGKNKSCACFGKVGARGVQTRAVYAGPSSCGSDGNQLV